MSLEMALEILKVLASALPAGLSVHEIVLRLRSPAAEVIRTIAVMQSRQWLRTNPRGNFSIGQHMLELAEFSQEPPGVHDNASFA
jgi:DNA-binding IclR family transcriptional regulator